MRVGLAGACLVGLLAVGCNGKTDAPASLTLSPSGAVTVLGPKTFQATAVNTGGPISWSLSPAGVGSLSDATGERTVYRPPAAPAVGATVTLTASSGAFTATAQLQLSPPALAGVKIPGLTAAVDVRYDAWEVPHIRCAQARDCYAVEGYLHARDRLFQMDFLRRAATGTLSTLIGPLGLSQDVQLRTIFTTRAGKRLGAELARNLRASTTPADVATVVVFDAYLGGINARLAELRAASTAPLGGEYAQIPFPTAAQDIPDWTLEDALSFARLQQYVLSSTLEEEIDFGRLVSEYGAGDPRVGAYIRTQQPSTEQTFTLQPAAPPTPLPALAAPGAGAPALSAAWAAPLRAVSASLGSLGAAIRAPAGSTGSNNWVIDAGHSATGKAMVANDPHLSLQYPPNFYLATLTSANPADNLDVTGGAFPGLPPALVGRGKHVGWGVTVVGYDVTDVYLEQAVPAGACPATTPPNRAFCVAYKGATADVLAYPVSYMVRVAPGAAGLVDAQTLPAAQRPPPIVAVVPHHGPIIQAPDAGGRAVSVRWTGHEDNTNDMKAFLGLNTAANVAEAMLALKSYATGAQNFVLADDSGAIGYDPHALVPVRPWATAAAMIGRTPTPHPPWFPLPGDGSAEWGPTGNTNCANAGASSPPASCWLTDAQLPQAVGSPTGFLATANADPVGTSASPFPIPVDANGNYLSFSWDDSTAFRHARVTERLQAASAGNRLITRGDVESIQGDHVSRLGAAFYPQIAKLTPPAGSDLAAAKGLIATWRAGGFDCPTGLLPGQIDPVLGQVDPTPAVATASAGCYLFHQFVRELLPAVFSDDLALAGVGTNPVMAVKSMLHMLENPPGSATPADQRFCNDVDANGNLVTPHTCMEQVAIALTRAFDRLAARLGDPTAGGWVWGRAHTFQPVSQAPMVTLGYEAGPFARPGGAFTVDVGNPSLTASGGITFSFRSSANVRHVSVMDPTNPVVRMQLPGPEKSFPYGVTVGPDLLADWARNTYFDYAHGDQILGATVATQSFTP